MQSQMFTFQTRLVLDDCAEAILAACSELFGRVERSLFAAISTGIEASSLKSDYIKKFKITARHFNSVKKILEGKIASIKERRPGLIAEMEMRRTAMKKTIEKLEKKSDKQQVLHQKKRKFNNLKSKLHKLKKDQEDKKVRLCFGSKKLFYSQFNLQENGYASHDEWLKEWQNERSCSFFLLGSKDELSGNQSCSLTLQENGKLTLRLRLPDAIQDQKYLFLTDIDFNYGHSKVVENLQIANKIRLLDKKSAVYKQLDSAMSYRFLRDEKGWRVFVSFSIAEPSWVTRDNIGAIGVDINVDHLAVTETDRFGNPIKHRSIPLRCYGKMKNQAKAIIGDAVQLLTSWAQKSQKPIVIEQLNFDKKKAELKELYHAKRSRTLSSFAYQAIINNIHSSGFCHGVKIKEVNPAYTSIIGWVKFSERYGLSKHEAAALSIARRYLELSERLPRSQGKIPDGYGGHVTFSLPVRNRGKHVWAQWGKVKKVVLAAHAAHIRAKRSSSRSPPACCDK